MAKGILHSILTGRLGRLGGIDRTIGREGGFSLNFGGKTSDNSVKLSSKVAPTRGGSSARHERAAVYCNCDDKYKLIKEFKRNLLVPWWNKILDKTYTGSYRYAVWMSLCLRGDTEAQVFFDYSHVTRYQVRNDTGATWRDQEIELTGIPNLGESDDNFRVFILFLTKTTRGNRTYEPGRIDRELSFELIEQGTIRLTSPFLASDGYYYIDVYSGPINCYG